MNGICYICNRPIEDKEEFLRSFISQTPMHVSCAKAGLPPDPDESQRIADDILERNENRLS